MYGFSCAAGWTMTVAVSHLIWRVGPSQEVHESAGCELSSTLGISSALRINLNVELKLVLDVKANQIAKHAEAPLGRQETLEVFQAEWAKLNLETCVLIPDVRAQHDRVASESLIRSRLANRGPLAFLEVTPLSYELSGLQLRLESNRSGCVSVPPSSAVVARECRRNRAARDRECAFGPATAAFPFR